MRFGVPKCDFIDVCFEYQENITYPVCTAFEPTVLDGQLCYRIDVNKAIKDLKNGVGNEAGLTFVVDNNSERSLALDKSISFGDGQESQDKTHLPSRPKEVDSIKVHIDTLEQFSAFGSGIFIMTSVKEIRCSPNFLEMAEDVRRCGLEDSVQECRSRNYLVDKPDDCNCTPEEFRLILENKVC